MRVKIGGKPIPASFLKIEGRGTLVGKKNWQMVRTQVLKHPPGARKGKRRGSEGDVRRGATARGAMEKGGCVGVIEGEEVRRDNPAE